MLLSFWWTNPMTKKHNNNDALAKGKDLITTWVGFSQVLYFLEQTSIIWPMYIKWSAVTDTAINGSLKCTLMKPFQSIVTQNDTQVSFIWIWKATLSIWTHSAFLIYQLCGSSTQDSWALPTPRTISNITSSSSSLIIRGRTFLLLSLIYTHADSSAVQISSDI